MTFGWRKPVPYTQGNRIRLAVGHLAAGVVWALVLACVFGGIVQFLWNRILPEVAGAKALSYWQGVGLTLLARILVGGFHHGHRNGHGDMHDTRRKAWADYDTWWKEAGEKSFRDSGGEV